MYSYMIRVYESCCMYISYVYMCVHMCIHMCRCMCIHTGMYIYIYIYIHSYLCIGLLVEVAPDLVGQVGGRLSIKDFPLLHKEIPYYV